MPTRPILVLCSTKDGDDRSASSAKITGIGGVVFDGETWKRWYEPKPVALEYVKENKFAFHVLIGGEPVKLVAKMLDGVMRIGTEKDTASVRYLFNLPDCSDTKRAIAMRPTS